VNQTNGHGVIRVRCNSDFAGTNARLLKAIQQRGLKLFAEIHHSEDAATVGLHMSPSTLFIFGNPVAGTPVMVSTLQLASIFR